jgi:Flp pilus assembly protein TadD
VDPRSGEIALERGLDALLAGDAAAALPELWRSRSLLANVGTDVAIGNAELGRGRPDAAVAAYQRALRRHPGSFRAHANLAMAYGQLGALALARQHLATARALQPGHPKLAEMAQRLGEQALPPPAAP